MRAAQAQWNRSVLGIAAAVEAVTGLFLLVFPHLVVNLLLGVAVTGISIVIGRVAGIALLSLGVGCWFGRQEATGGWALAAMLVYSVLVTLYFAWVGLGARGPVVVARRRGPRRPDGAARLGLVEKSLDWA